MNTSTSLEQNQDNFSKEQVISSPIELLQKSFKIFKLGFWDLMKMLLVPFLGMVPLVIVLAIFGFFNFILKDSGIANGVVNFILGLLGIASVVVLIYVATVAKIGMYRLINNRMESMATHETKSIKEILMNSRKYFWSYIAVSILVFIFVMLWSILFIIPGIIFAIYYSFSIWSLIIGDNKPSKSIKRSRELVKDYWWAVVGRFLFLGLIYIIFIMITSIPYIFVGDESIAGMIWGGFVNLVVFILSPLALIYNYFIYKDLVKIKGESKNK